MDPDAVIQTTRRWIETFVIGLNLCPFAERVFQAGRIRYAVSTAENEAALLADLAAELAALEASRDIETTLLIHPRALRDFFEYNDFLDDVDHLVEDMGLDEVIQIASFHPDYLFADTLPEAPENYTNRSPYPMLHLLRQDSITAVAEQDEAALQAIPERNIATLQALGLAKVREMLQEVLSPRG